MNAHIAIPPEQVAAFCKRWKVTELALFGSVLRDDFGPESDVDVLVRFESEHTPGLFGIVRMERELSELFGRQVDLVTRDYIRRKAILNSAQVVYAA